MVEEVYTRAKWPIRPALNSGFYGMKQLGVFLFPLRWDASPLPPALTLPVPIYRKAL